LVALGLGGNLGDRAAIENTLHHALQQLAGALAAPRIAALYRGAAVSAIPQPDYLNTAVVGRTHLAPEALLAVAKALEFAAGRRLGPRDGPRPLDIDLLLYEGRQSRWPELTLPHPRLAERRFVLAPLAEIAPDFPIPHLGASASELLRRLPASAPAVERLAWNLAGR
jgi:2-amino-4-hydroxy-6-hydroxymethyldihydropteridine diphosphokinase